MNELPEGLFCRVEALAARVRHGRAIAAAVVEGNHVGRIFVDDDARPATSAACAFVEGCLEERLRPQWSCWHNNAASLALAEKLVFTNPHEVPVSLAPRERPA